MAQDAQKAASKRKRPSDEPIGPDLFPEKLDLQTLSDQEGEGDSDASSDGSLEEFPEVDLGDDTEDEEESDEPGNESEESNESSDEENAESGESLSDESANEDEGTDSDDLHIYPKSKDVISDITGKVKRVYPDINPEYDSDSSTEDDPNRVGRIPMHLYDNLPHVGYDIDGKRILRPAVGDELDKFLKTVDDPSAWTSAFHKTAQMEKPLDAEELDIIHRLQANEVSDATYDLYQPMTEWFTGKGKQEVMPLSAAPEPKRRWVPSKWEKEKVLKIVRAIRQGRILPNKPRTAKPQFYAIWSEPPSEHPPPLPVPKMPLPTNSESYNPPEEYLFAPEEEEQWRAADPEDREQNFLPQKYSALRLVPGYEKFINERFNRQLDIYMAPRIQRKKLNLDPNALIPKLPSPNSLRPFPNYKSHKVLHDKVRTRAISVSPDGAWVVSGDESGLVLLWEVNVGKVVKVWSFGSKIGALEWCPRQDVNFFVVGVEEALHFLVPPHLPSDIFNSTTTLLASAPPLNNLQPSPIKWVNKPSNTPPKNDSLLTVHLPSSSGLISQITWHRKGDYMATVSASGGQGGVWIHQISRHHSQSPFKKVRGSVQMVLFHPTLPNFFVATQRYVRIYHLSEQKLLKTLMPGIRWISSLDIHPSGDHLIVGGYDRKLCWFDLELSDKPYKILRYHSRAIRSLQFHPTYPLFASSSDDGTIQVFHARVFNDLMTDPLIVPLKILRGHEVEAGLGVLQVRWCPKHPWLISAGADGAVGVWCS